jgi:hypothetical protein
MSDYLPIAIPTILLGLAILLYCWLCWSGRNQGWHEHSRRWTWVVLGLLPGQGLLVLGLGIAMLDYGGPTGRACAAVGAAAAGLGFIVGIVEPSWWGPAWFRELRDSERNATQGDMASMRTVHIITLDGKRPSAAERDLADSSLHRVEPIEEWNATLVERFSDGSGTPGRLQLFEDGVLFLEERGANEIDGGAPLLCAYSMPVEDIRGVQLIYKLARRIDDSSQLEYTERDTPLLLIENSNGLNLMFNLPFVTSTARRIASMVGSEVVESR